MSHRVDFTSARSIMEHANHVTRAIRDCDVTRIKLATIIESHAVTVDELRAEIASLKAQLAAQSKQSCVDCKRLHATDDLVIGTDDELRCSDCIDDIAARYEDARDDAADMRYRERRDEDWRAP